MRPREEISLPSKLNSSVKNHELIVIEVLLDIRDLLIKIKGDKND